MDAATDAECWERWYRRNGGKLLLFARGQTRCEADAQDVVQEAVVKVWRSGGRGGHAAGGPPPLSHFFRSIRQCAVDLGRSIDRRARREQRVAVDWFGSAELAAEAGSGGVFLPGELEAALVALPDRQREVLVLKIWGELTFREVGEVLGISPETAASRYRYALGKLRRSLSSRDIPAGHARDHERRP